MAALMIQKLASFNLDDTDKLNREEIIIVNRQVNLAKFAFWGLSNLAASIPQVCQIVYEEGAFT
jgi:hypothetical protein